jgi:predicted permease
MNIPLWMVLAVSISLVAFLAWLLWRIRVKNRALATVEEFFQAGCVSFDNGVDWNGMNEGEHWATLVLDEVRQARDS